MVSSVLSMPPPVIRAFSDWPSLEPPSLLLSLVLTIFRNLRKLLLRYLALPRPPFLAVGLVREMPNPGTNLYNFERKGLQPWYIQSTFWSKWGPGAWLVKLLGGKVPSTHGDRYLPQGYDLMTIGPEPQRGKGLEEMSLDVEAIRARGVATCPFSQAKSGNLM